MGEQRAMSGGVGGDKVSVLFVCLGNICRSPTAHGVLVQRVQQQQLGHLISVDSAGTGDWHIGRGPDPRTCAAALRRGYDLSAQRARQVSAKDFQRFDYILAMDRQNLRDLQRLQPESFRGELGLLLSYGDHDIHDVPDPYYGDVADFERVLDLVEHASQQFLQTLIERHRLLRAAE